MENLLLWTGFGNKGYPLPKYCRTFLFMLRLKSVISRREIMTNHSRPGSIATALACSYNIPAVRLLEQIGPESSAPSSSNGWAFLFSPNRRRIMDSG